MILTAYFVLVGFFLACSPYEGCIGAAPLFIHHRSHNLITALTCLFDSFKEASVPYDTFRKKLFLMMTNQNLVAKVSQKTLLDRVD